MKKIGWGLVGCGDISRKRVAPAIGGIPESELVAVSRARSELAGEFAAEFGARRWYADWRELITDPELAAVYLATPVDLHAEQAIAAAEAGKHVLCEKPMAMSVAQCDRVIAACRAHGVKLGIAYYRHFYPVISRIKELIGSGEIGAPVIAQLSAFEMFNPRPGEPRYWFVQKTHAGGGPMMDFGCHRIEVLMNIFGRIKATTSVVDSIIFEREVEDTALAIFELEQRVRGTLTVTHAAFESQDTLEIFCHRGSIRVPQLNRGLLRIVTAEGERTELHPPAPNIHQPLIQDFVQALLEQREPKVGGEIGREVARIVEQIYSSNM